MKKPDVNKMTLREKIGQVLLVRQSDLLMRADKNYSELRDPREAKELLAEYQFGGIWAHGNQDVNGMSDKYNDYFKFTTKSYTAWLKDVTENMTIPPVCANDLGGYLFCSDMHLYAGGLIMGAANSEALAFEFGRNLALEYKSAGINWLWCQEVDLVNRFSGEVGRAFSNDMDQIIKLTRAFIQGIQSVGMAATLKHFPGRDRLDTRDSHVVTGIIKTPVAEWEQEQGAVFQQLIDSGADAVMSVGITYPNMDNTRINGRYLPAGLSHKIITEVLKEKMGFAGVVITDDVNMAGFAAFYDHSELYGRFLAAGNDILLGVGIDAVDLVEDCVRRGIVTEERITDACRRVLNLKEKVGLFRDDYARDSVKIEDVAPAAAASAKKIAEKAITLVRDNVNLLPLKEKPRKVTVYTYSHNEAVRSSLQTMAEAFRRRGAQVDLRRTPESFAEVAEAAQNSDLIVYVGHIAFHDPMGEPSFFGSEFWALRYAFSAGREKSVGISTGFPFIHYMFMDDAEAFINCYSPDTCVQEAVVKAIYGEIGFDGVAPLDMRTP